MKVKVKKIPAPVRKQGNAIILLMRLRNKAMKFGISEHLSIGDCRKTELKNNDLLSLNSFTYSDDQIRKIKYVTESLNELRSATYHR